MPREPPGTRPAFDHGMSIRLTSPSTYRLMDGLKLARQLPIGSQAVPKSAQRDETCQAAVGTRYGADAAPTAAAASGGAGPPVARDAGELLGVEAGAPDIDGALVGGASLDPEEFARITSYRRSRSA